LDAFGEQRGPQLSPLTAVYESQPKPLDSRGQCVVEAGKVNWHPEPVVVHPVRRPRVGRRRGGGGGEEHGFPRGTCRQLVHPRIDGVPVGCQFLDVLVLIPFRTTAFFRWCMDSQASESGFQGPCLHGIEGTEKVLRV